MPKTKELYGNYQYSLTSQQQASIQIFLRLLPKRCSKMAAWQLLHDLTYAKSWTPEPQFDQPERKSTVEQVFTEMTEPLRVPDVKDMPLK